MRCKYTTEGNFLTAMIDGSVRDVELDERPYGFVLKSEEDRVARLGYGLDDTDLTTPFGQPVTKITTQNWWNFKDLNKILYGKLHETDVKHERRLIIDKIFEVGYDNVAHVDIELWDKDGFPVLEEAGKHNIICIANHYKKGRCKWFYVDDYDDEAHMLGEWVRHLKKRNATIMTGYNVRFDYGHLFHRSKVLGAADYKYLYYMDTVDMYYNYMDAAKGLEGYTLGEVSEHEGWIPKHRDKMIWEMNKEELEEYNMYDAELCKMIDERYGFTDIKMEIADKFNLNIEAQSPVSMTDALIIRRARELGYVLKNIGGYKDVYEGGFVDARSYGVFNNVGYFDVSGMYPNIIINENIDLDGFNGEMLPVIQKRLREARDEHKMKYKQTGNLSEYFAQYAYKIGGNAIYGSLANEWFRYCNSRKAALITGFGQDMIKRCAKYAEEKLGLEPLYIDTDGLFINLDGVSRDVEESANLVLDLLNEYIKPYKMDLEMILDKIFFYRSGEGGTKKRYYGVDLDGNVLVRGIESRRRDWCRLSKIVQQEVFKIIFDGGDEIKIMKYLSNVKNDLFNGKYDKKLIMVKKFRNLDSYDSMNLPHLRALQKVGAGAFPDNRVKFVAANGDFEPIVDEKDLNSLKLEYNWYWDNQIMAVVNRILNGLGANPNDYEITTNGYIRQEKLV